MASPLDSFKGAFDDLQKVIWNPATIGSDKEEYLQPDAINEINTKIHNLANKDIFKDNKAELESIEKQFKALGDKINLRDPAFEEIGNNIQKLRNRILEREAKAIPPEPKAGTSRGQLPLGSLTSTSYGKQIHTFLGTEDIEALGQTDGRVKRAAIKEAEQRKELQGYETFINGFYKYKDFDLKQSGKKNYERVVAEKNKFLEGLKQKDTTAEKIAACINFINNNPVIQDSDVLFLPNQDLSQFVNDKLKFPNVTTIRLFQCRLTKVPDFISKCDNLECLHLGQNSITDLPPWLFNLKRLRELELQYNKITKLTDGIEGSKLKKIDLRENPLSDDSKKYLGSIVGVKITVGLFL